jgi:hypothetical protein
VKRRQNIIRRGTGLFEVDRGSLNNIRNAGDIVRPSNRDPQEKHQKYEST